MDGGRRRVAVGLASGVRDHHGDVGQQERADDQDPAQRALTEIAPRKQTVRRPIENRYLRVRPRWSSESDMRAAVIR